jgi:hypothetical protein
MKKTYKCLMNSTSGMVDTLIVRDDTETATRQLVERKIIVEYTDEDREWDEAVALAAIETTPEALALAEAETEAEALALAEALVKAPAAPAKKKGSK